MAIHSKIMWVEWHSIRRERGKKRVFPINQNGGRHGRMKKLPKKNTTTQTSTESNPPLADRQYKEVRWYYTSYPRSSHDLTLLLYLYPGDTRVFSRFLRLLLVLGVLPSLWGINMKRHTGLLFLQPPLFLDSHTLPDSHSHYTFTMLRDPPSSRLSPAYTIYVIWPPVLVRASE
jgi:hypothetical protein